MLNSKRDRFVWSKEDRTPDMSFFRMLYQNWHPTVRVVIAVEERVVSSGRRGYRSSLNTAPARSAKAAWTPWLWVGS